MSSKTVCICPRVEIVLARVENFVIFLCIVCIFMIVSNLSLPVIKLIPMYLQHCCAVHVLLFASPVMLFASVKKGCRYGCCFELLQANAVGWFPSARRKQWCMFYWGAYIGNEGSRWTIKLQCYRSLTCMILLS